ncbi:MAG: response regulator [Ilumatobacteraceae bacterium]
MNETKKPVIVVADDDRDICELIKLQLSRNGFEVFITDNGQTALDLIVKHEPAIALLDIMMPKLSGLEVARQIRGNPKLATVSIMLISARSSGRIESDLDDIGISDYISKPFSPQELVQRINEVISKKSDKSPKRS